ncbi:hypothetical protein X770_25335 [Mesorhizobium sp. LSJC269B00]|nr:hypothetical protein X770_25335 [Mesorhizobium sp. LSJC269B00]
MAELTSAIGGSAELCRQKGKDGIAIARLVIPQQVHMARSFEPDQL